MLFSKRKAYSVQRARRYADQVLAFKIDFDASSGTEEERGKEYLHSKKYLRRRAKRPLAVDVLGAFPHQWALH